MKKLKGKPFKLMAWFLYMEEQKNYLRLFEILNFLKLTGNAGDLANCQGGTKSRNFGITNTAIYRNTFASIFNLNVNNYIIQKHEKHLTFLLYWQKQKKSEQAWCPAVTVFSFFLFFLPIPMILTVKIDLMGTISGHFIHTYSLFLKFEQTSLIASIILKKCPAVAKT